MDPWRSGNLHVSVAVERLDQLRTGRHSITIHRLPHAASEDANCWCDPVVIEPSDKRPLRDILNSLGWWPGVH